MTYLQKWLDKKAIFIALDCQTKSCLLYRDKPDAVCKAGEHLWAFPSLVSHSPVLGSACTEGTQPVPAAVHPPFSFHPSCQGRQRTVGQPCSDRPGYQRALAQELALLCLEVGRWQWEHVGTTRPGGHRAHPAHQPARETVILKGSRAGKRQKSYKMESPFWPKAETKERTLVCCRHHRPAPELHNHRKRDFFHSSLYIWFWSASFSSVV